MSHLYRLEVNYTDGLKISTIVISYDFNSYKPGVPFVGHRQTE